MGKHGQYGALVACLLAAPAAAECRLALALGMDVSRSISHGDYEIQRQGLVQALGAAEVRAAMLAPPDHVALAIYEWSGEGIQTVVLPWTEIRVPSDIDRVMAAVSAHRRDERRLATALGEALSFGRAILDQAPVCTARTLDISGDGQNNQGPEPRQIYAGTDFSGITVNGLAIGAHERNLTAYYEAELVHGPGAFVISAPDQQDFPRAIRVKLERELRVRLIGQGPTAGRAG